MDFRRKRRVLTRSLAGAAVVTAIAGCGGHPAPTDVIPDESGTGAVIRAAKQDAKAGDTVVFDTSGSAFDTHTDKCPDAVSMFVDGVEGRAAYKVYDEDANKLETITTAGACRVANGQFSLTLPAGAPGTTETRKVTAVAQKFVDGGFFSSKASVDVRVATPGAGSSPSPSPSAAPSATAKPTASPTVTAAPTATATATPPPALCPASGSHTGGGQTPDVRFTLNPDPSTVGDFTLIDASATDDPDGTITKYRFDFNGDGTYEQERATPYEAFTPTAEGQITVCVEATDNAGNTSVGGLKTDVKPSGYLRADSFGHSPFEPQDGEDTEFTIPTPNDADVVLDYGDGDFDIAVRPHAGTSVKFTHKYAAPGYYAATTTVNNDAAEASSWSDYIHVIPHARGVARIAGLDPFPIASASKAYKLTTLLKQTKDKIVKKGKITFEHGVLHSKNTITRARARGSLPKKLRKVKALRGLKALYNADFVAQLNGIQVPLTPDTWGIGGTAKILAQGHKDRRTRICLSMGSDGRTLAGTKWNVLGATGKARGLKGGGTYAPIVLGPRLAPEPKGTATISKGKARGIGACKSLVKYLPRGKK